MGQLCRGLHNTSKSANMVQSKFNFTKPTVKCQHHLTASNFEHINSGGTFLHPATEKEDEEDDILTYEQKGRFPQPCSLHTLVFVLETRTVFLEQKSSFVFHFLRYFLMALDRTIRTTRYTTTPATSTNT